MSIQLKLGPDPEGSWTRGAGFEIRSTALAQPVTVKADYLVQAHLDDPTVHRSASPLLNNLYRSGRIQQVPALR